MNRPDASSTHGLPLVVQISFIGKRELGRVGAASGYEEGLQRLLCERLADLPARFGLGPRHRIVGLSSLAIGADMLFTRACRKLGWPQRIFLPQAREDFLAAVGSEGPDFSDAQRRAVRELFSSPHLIEECVASTSADRRGRFEDVNLELVRVSDVVICLLPEGASEDKAAGARSVLELAKRWGRPVLELRFGVQGDGAASLRDIWHAPPSPGGFRPPALPMPLDKIECEPGDGSDAQAYRSNLKTFASDAATRNQARFKFAALAIVGFHVLATTLALLALLVHGAGALPWLLGVELAVLASGLAYHEWLHRSHAARDWAMARLAAEVARSAIPMAGVPRPLRHLFELPMPLELRPLLRTLNVLHLEGLQKNVQTDWKARRDQYVSERLTAEKGGQIGYYEEMLNLARRHLCLARSLFYFGSAGALLATAAKFSLKLHWWNVAASAYDPVTATLGFLAVLLPVMAVAALSLAAAFDLEARAHTYAETLAFLREQTKCLSAADSENEFATLALQTESILLGETAHWHARRSFTDIA